MSTVEGPCFPAFSRYEAMQVAGALTESAYACAESDPNRSVALHAYAQRIQRHVFAVRPLVYRIAVEPVIAQEVPA